MPPAKTYLSPRVPVDNRQTCSMWLDWLRAHGRAPLTVYQYGAKLDELLAFLDGKPLSDVRLDDLEAWVARPRRGRGGGGLGTDATRAKDVIVVRGLWKWAVAHGRLVYNPTLDLEMPKVRNEAPRAVPEKLWSQFWSSPMLTEVERVVYGLQFFGGLRRFEVCHLGPQHIDVADGFLVDFKRKGDRNSSKPSPLPIVSCARLFAEKHPGLLPDAGAFLAPLKELALTRRGMDFLIPWGEEAVANPCAWRNGERPVRPVNMTSPDQITNRLQQALVRAGMPARAFTPHALRHSFVTYLLRGGVPLEVVSRLANHSSLNITMRYLKFEDDPIADLLDQPPLKGSRW